ncbi:MAG: Stp1/IreP family PP2C-type Ser/Thr phosphatase, partial [Anaerolineae bacterium]|nr:Stp1/IreP family PP2C-type Ser/Thr phosphatase [Anaerolineae bacterium]
TSTGQVRENNEDNIHLWTRDDFVLAVVADGMGGAAAGEEASRIAVESIKNGLALREQRLPEKFEHIEDATLTDKLKETIQTANLSIMQKAAASPEMRGMGTTVTLAFVRGTYAIVAHVGDSRAYLVDGDDHEITQITSDHSFVEALLSAGHITKEQADEHPMKNVLYRALGQSEDIDVDMYYKRLHIGDRLVLCSDGLTRHVKPEEIARLVMSDSNPDVASQKLIDLANERGGEDNVSVIVISVEQTTPTSGSQNDAVMLAAADDDETLVLKDRASMRSSLPDLDKLDDTDKLTPTPDASEQPVPDTPKTADSVPSEPAPSTAGVPPVDDYKMMAEPLKDTGEVEAVPDDEATQDFDPIADDSIDRAISLRPDAMQESPVLESVPPVVQQEGQVEGRDTLLPDQ